MKVPSLWQPWASAIALGLKTWETRGWATSYRGLIAIHAAKQDPVIAVGAAIGRDLVAEYSGRVGEALSGLPRGGLVATAYLAAVRRSREVRSTGLTRVLTAEERAAIRKLGAA